MKNCNEWKGIDDNGNCCCNCIHRFVYGNNVSGRGFVRVGYVCDIAGVVDNTKDMSQVEKHGLCEMHQRQA